ncbi:metallothionein expression activator [Diplogelasinospora grovesii]|uniref:Metallothionein expression activator n=1 Tax=Diplogelasinospora grovesii TaxID=303347 RepID=A0AAN6S2X7_9PEZI|nr:metallothionein expression activator [Diplogelasinospora grovesii]
MSTTAGSNHSHVPPSDLYDPDEVLPKNSPLLAPHRPKLRITPSPPPILPYFKVSPPSSPGGRRSNRRIKVQPSRGDAVLVGFLDGGRRPEIAYQAGLQALPSDTEEEEEMISSDSEDSLESAVSRQRDDDQTGQGQGDGDWRQGDSAAKESISPGTSQQGDMGAFDLKSLAAGALAFAVPEPRPAPLDAVFTPPVTEQDVARERPQPAPIPIPPTIAPARRESAVDERPSQSTPGPPSGPSSGPSSMPPSALSPYSPRSFFSPREPIRLPPTNGLSSGLAPGSSHGEGLPPIQSETNGQTPLPSIKAQLGDLNQLAQDHIHENQMTQFGLPRSPPGSLPRLPSMNHVSSPISPPDTYRRDPMSPGQHAHQSATNPGFFPGLPTNGYHRPPPSSQHDYASSSTETPNSDHSGSTAATSIDRMSIDGLTNPPGAYICKYAGCNAPPFQTQYLLNSHANVHSSARPHYCPVQGCPRSEGGKGFKRKNEMIRHGLVHDSPGYVCPFCPDREHKYPRPDNLQRHVRVHHVDKDKDDPMLRDVLAQRPDGPNRGRRRRGAG